MSVSSKLVVLKIGGSILNPKSDFSKINREIVLNIGRELARLRRSQGYRFILIHGGGGLAHTAVRLLRPGDVRGDLTAGASLTKTLLLYLKLELCRLLLQAGLPVYPLDTEAVVREERDSLTIEVAKVRRVIEKNVVPVLNGDLELSERGSIIVSGDLVAYMLCEALRPATCIFLIDKKGVLDERGRTIPALRGEDVCRINLYKKGVTDVTGGMKTKLEYSLKIAKLGVRTYICPGTEPSVLREVLLGDHSSRCTRVLP